MKYRALVLVLSCITLTVKAQFPVSANARDEQNFRTGHWTMLFDSTWHEVHDTDSAVYYRLITFQKGKPVGKVRDFYKSGQKQWDGYLLSIEPDVFEGESKIYFQNGKMKLHAWYKNGVLNGSYHEYNVRGTLITEGTYENNLLVGRYVSYHENGNVYYEGAMKNGQLHGDLTTYFDHGAVLAKGRMEEGKMADMWIYYHPNGNIQTRIFYINGVMNGIYEVYTEQGVLKEKGFTKDGYRDGDWVTYYENGNIQEVGAYESAGQKTGIWKEYYEDGVLKSEGPMSENLRHGAFKFYHQNKAVLSAGNYEHDKRKGMWSFYYDNGNLQTYGSYYDNDSLEGHWIFYFPNGHVNAEGNYVRSKREGQWKYYDEKDNDNVTLHDHKNDLAHGIAIKYYPDGTIADEYYYQDGVMQGPRSQFYRGGQLKAKMNYENGLLAGDYISYYQDGQIEIKTAYKEDKLDGPYVYYHANGKVYQRGTYDRGRKIIEWEEYFANGQLGVRKKYNKGKYTWIEYFESGHKKSEGEGITSGENDLQNGYQKKYFENGILNSKGININGQPQGKFVYYDSLTGKKSTEGSYLNGKYDGPWTFYDEKGKFSSVSYFIEGFRETCDNVKDSIINLLTYKEYDLALKHIPWYERVLKRDIPESDPRWASHHKWLGEIYLGREEYDRALASYVKFRDESARLESDSSYNYILALNGIANTYSVMKKYEESYKINDLLVSKTEPDNDDMVIYSYNRAINLYNLDRIEEGSQSLMKEWERRTSSYGDSSAKAVFALNYLAAYQYYFEDDNDKAMESYTKLANLVEENDSRYLEALRIIAEIYNYNSNYESAIVYITESLDVQKRMKRDFYPPYFEDVIKLSTYHRNKNEYLVALQQIGDAVKILNANNKLRSYEGAMLLYEASSIFSGDLSDFKTALTYAEKSKEILDEAGRTDITLYGKVLYMLALCYNVDPLTYEKAAHYYLLSLEFTKARVGAKSAKYYEELVSFANYYVNGYQFAKSDSLLTIIEDDVRNIFGMENYIYASVNKSLGNLRKLQNRYSESLVYYLKEHAYYEKRKESEPRMFIGSLRDLHYLYDIMGDDEKAEQYIREALKIQETYVSKDLPAYTDLQMLLAYVLKKRMLYNESIDLYNTIIASYRDQMGEESQKYRSAVFELAKLYIALREYRKAEEYLKISTGLSLKHSGTPPEEDYYQGLLELADVKAAQGKNSEAEYYFKAAREAGLPYQANALYFFFLQRYAVYCEGQSRYSMAEQLLTEAVGHARDLVGEDHWYFAILAVNLSRVYREMGKYAESEAMIQKALHGAEANKQENEASYISVLRSLAQNYRATGRYEEAEELHHSILDYVYEREGGSNWYAMELLDAARLYFDWGKLDRVKSMNLDALSIFEDNLAPDDENVLTAHDQLGLLALQNHQHDSAEYYFNYCRERYEISGKVKTEGYANALHNLGTVATRTGKFQEAELRFKKAMTVRAENDIQMSLETEAGFFDDVAILYHTWGKHEQAEPYWEQTLQRLLTHIRTNFPFMSDYEKAKFWERNKTAFEYFNTFAVSRHQKNPSVLSDMYNYRLATKGILLSASNKLRKRIYASKDSVLISQYHHWTELREQVAKEYARASSSEKTFTIDSLEEKINDLEKELSLSADDGKEDRDRLINWKDIQRSLQPNEAAVEFIRYRHYNNQLTDSVVYAALIVTAETRNAPRIVVFPSGKFLEGKAYRYYRNCILVKLNDDLSFKHFWQPIEAIVGNKSTIYLSLDGVFNQINFKTLRTPDQTYLMDRKDFVVVSNTRDIVAMKTRKKLKLFENASLIGNPKFFLHGKSTPGESSTRDADDIDRGAIAELPGTGVEVQTIEKLLLTNGWRVNAFVEGEASESNIKQLPSSRVLHFATHGFFQESTNVNWSTADPMLRSGILLSGAANFIQHKTEDTGENGILTAYEAANLSLEGTEMVVLSACETARGEIQQGEGVYGLQRAFITAGAESLVMSLWKVDDEATQKLMSAFYANWMKGMDKSEALNEAQRAIKKLYPHPYYWGAFVMIKG